MINDIRENLCRLKNLYDEVLVTDGLINNLMLDEAIKKSAENIIECSRSGKKLILIGNGASASIASHIATDLWKNANIRAIAFNDAAGLTCVSNDLGYSQVFAKPIEMFADPGDILIAISSSGKSENILHATEKAIVNCLKVITLSGFKQDNPLRQMGNMNFYVPSDSYGQVETMHQAICHVIVDSIVFEKEKGKLK